MNFLIVDDLGKFDLAIGMNSLRKMNAKLDLMSFRLTYIDRDKTTKQSHSVKNSFFR